MPEGIHWRGDRVYVVLREPDPLNPSRKKVVWHAGTTYGFNDEESALAWRDQRRQDLRVGRAAARDKITVSDYLSEWLPAHALTKDLKPSTIDSYKEKISYVSNHTLGQMQLQLVKPIDIKRFYSDLLTKGGVNKTGLSKRTVEFVGTLLKKAFRDAMTEYGLRGDSPAEHIAIPRPRHTETKIWSSDEMSRLINVIRQDRYGRMFVVQSATGARRGEMLGLRWSDIDLEIGVITFHTNRVKVHGGMVEHSLKSGLSKRVTIDPATVLLLKEHRVKQKEDRLRAGSRWLDADYVFPNVFGGPLNPSNMARYWKAIIEQANVTYIKPHALRHTHATLLLEAGVPAHVVAERLGHKDVTTTFKVYAHVTAKQQDEAADTYAKWLSSGQP
jgi:integrase